MSSIIGGAEWALALALVFLVAVIAHQTLDWLQIEDFPGGPSSEFSEHWPVWLP